MYYGAAPEKKESNWLWWLAGAGLAYYGIVALAASRDRAAASAGGEGSGPDILTDESGVVPDRVSREEAKRRYLRFMHDDPEDYQAALKREGLAASPSRSRPKRPKRRRSR